MSSRAQEHFPAKTSAQDVLVGFDGWGDTPTSPGSSNGTVGTTREASVDVPLANEGYSLRENA